MTKPSVVFFQRKPYPTGHYSVEFIFRDLRERLKEAVECRVEVSSFYSRGIWRRLLNSVEAAFRQGEVNFIAGDVHYLSLFMRRDRTILTILDCGFMRQPEGVRRWLEKTFWFTLPAKRVSRITTISESVKRELLEILDIEPDRIVVIPVAIDRTFSYRPRKRAPGEKPVLLQVGQSENKNLMRIIEAVRPLNVRLQTIGEIPEKAAVLLKEYGIDHVNMCNLSPEKMREAYAGCDVLLFPSTYEGFGMPILEAQAVGRPVVTADTASMPWVAGEAACLVDPLSVDSIRGGIVRLLGDEAYCAELVSKGLENVKRFDPERIARQYYDVISSVRSKVK